MGRCMRDRDDEHFKAWAQDRTKSRLCDDCKEGIKDHNVYLTKKKNGQRSAKLNLSD